MIERYDRPHTLFYLDPPYYECENYYGDGLFSRDDFVRLSDQLSQIKGKFILSINDTPEIRQIFSEFDCKEVSTMYSVRGGGKQKPVNELLFANYKLATI